MTPRQRVRASITGIGQTEFSKSAGRSETRLAAEAIVAALADAGLTTDDVDGLVSFTIDPVEEIELVRALGIPEIGWSSRMPYGGAGSQGVFVHAASAVMSGVADVVVVYRALRSRSGVRFGAASARDKVSTTHSGTTTGQWCYPYGILTPASWVSLNATRYMHRFGVRNEDFGRAVVQLRGYAAANPHSHFHNRPITLDDHQSSPWIAEPSLRLLDCCQETDGAVAFVVTSNERSRDTRAPVSIVAAAGASLCGQEVATDHYSPDLSVLSGTAALAEKLFEKAAISRADIDVAMIYDAFSPVLLMQLEALGFCGPGEAKDFVADGHLGPKGMLPCNTNGGLIGEGYLHGMNLTLEAVRQLRGDSANQLAQPRLALVAAVRTGVVLGRP